MSKDKKSERKIFRAADLPVVFLLIAASVFAASINFFNRSSGDLTAIIRCNSDEIYRINLSQLNEEKQYLIQGKNSINLTVKLSHNCAEVSFSECEDQICVNTGILTKAGQSAVCLPAAVSVEIVAENSNSQLDGTVG